MISKFFIDRPIFASVLSIVITLAGGIAAWNLPIAQYPQIAPPTVSVMCTYPGASAQDVALAVAAPIEQQVNGVEGMMYMSSACTNDGSYSLTVTFEHGVDLNMAQVLVQNRVSLAVPMLPDVIKATGVTTRKRSPDILMVVAINSPGGKLDQLFLSNYALMHVRDELSRLPGVSDVFMLGQRDYSMRVWVDPEKLAERRITAGDVVAALREQNQQVAVGQVGQPPAPEGQPIQVTLSTLGRLETVEQFENVVVKAGPQGQLVRLKDVARVQLGAKSLDISTKVNGKPSASLAIFQLPDANALDTANVIKDKMKELKAEFPEGVDYEIRYDTTPFINESIGEVYKTLIEAVVLVAVVVLLFLQNWRSALIPLVAVPVAIFGTFAVMIAFGFSLNNLTLFGLVLAIGIVVDDAIVVVEAVEHHMEHGLAPRDATVKAMEEVSGPVIAIGLVLSAVFVPCAFISGIVGQFFRQFALTIASSTIISAFNSLTLSPALAALLLRPREEGVRAAALPRPLYAVLGGALGWFLLAPALAPRAGVSPAAATAVASWFPWACVAAAAVAGWVVGWPLDRFLAGFFRLFNAAFRLVTGGYIRVVGGLLRVSPLVVLAYGGLLFLTYYGFKRTPSGFIPSQDMGYLLVNIQLPDSASSERTAAVMDRLEQIAHSVEGIKHTQTIAGQSFLLNAYGSNFGSMFLMLDDFSKRHDPRLSATAILGALTRAFTEGMPEETYLKKKNFLTGKPYTPAEARDLSRGVPEAAVAVFPPPPVRGVGRAGGFMIMIEDRGSVVGPSVLQAQTQNLVELGNNAELEGSGLPRGLGEFELRLEPPGAPPAAAGRELIAVADEGGKLRVRVFDAEGVAVMDADERKADAAAARRFGDLRGSLDGLRPPRAIARAEKAKVVAAVKLLEDRHPALTGLSSVFRANVPQLYADINRVACMSKQVALRDLFDTLQIYLGSLYVNDFNRFGRTWQVIVQADQAFRNRMEDIKRLKVRNLEGTMVPVGSLATIREQTGPLILTRYNMYPAAQINGSAAPGISSGQAISLMEQLTRAELPPSMGYEWTELAYLELKAGNTAMRIFGLAVLFVFLVLAAQYESWSLPLAIILVVPMCLLGGIAGVQYTGKDVNIFTQIGFVVLVGLASKNAILIVEFAKMRREAGESRREATLDACRLRLRPIVMTSLAFILGVVPLIVGRGAGAEMRQTLGTTVFSGMIGVTVFGLLLTPIFFFVIDWLGGTPLFHARAVRLLAGWAIDAISLRPVRGLIGGAGRGGAAKPARPAGAADLE